MANSHHADVLSCLGLIQPRNQQEILLSAQDCCSQRGQRRMQEADQKWLLLLCLRSGRAELDNGCVYGDHLVKLAFCGFVCGTLASRLLLCNSVGVCSPRPEFFFRILAVPMSDHSRLLLIFKKCTLINKKVKKVLLVSPGQDWQQHIKAGCNLHKGSIKIKMFQSQYKYHRNHKPSQNPGNTAWLK